MSREYKIESKKGGMQGEHKAFIWDDDKYELIEDYPLVYIEERLKRINLHVEIIRFMRKYGVISLKVKKV